MKNKAVDTPGNFMPISGIPDIGDFTRRLRRSASLVPNKNVDPLEPSVFQFCLFVKEKPDYGLEESETDFKNADHERGPSSVMVSDRKFRYTLTSCN